MKLKIYQFRLGALLLMTIVNCGGCGLVFIPLVHACPDPVRRIRVVDERSDEVIPNATVRFTIEPHANWFRMPTGLGPAVDVAESPTDRALRVSRDADGTFVPEQVWRVGWVQWFFPLPLPLGWELYRDNRVVLTARANDREGLCLSYHPESGPRRGWHDECPAGTARMEGNTLVFRLRVAAGRATTAPLN